ncbi:MAG: zf-HC2 domain-containing protein [Pseudomonadota bacterium]|nr:MAG: zf-HC2 domain-containing protein [Pseudomonadota bacterium]
MSDEPRKINCDEAVRKLFEYLDKELGASDHAAVEAHLHSCRSCFSRMEFDKRLRGMIKGADPASAPDPLRERIKKITERF